MVGGGSRVGKGMGRGVEEEGEAGGDEHGDVGVVGW